jgi:hypothetical protein
MNRKSWTRFDLIGMFPACHAGGRGFKSRLSRHYFKYLAVRFTDLSKNDIPSKAGTVAALILVSLLYLLRAQI